MHAASSPMDDEYLRVAKALLLLAFIRPPATPEGAAAAAFMAAAVCLAVLTTVSLQKVL